MRTRFEKVEVGRLRELLMKLNWLNDILDNSPVALMVRVLIINVRKDKPEHGLFYVRSS